MERPPPPVPAVSTSFTLTELDTKDTLYFVLSTSASLLTLKRPVLLPRRIASSWSADHLTRCRHPLLYSKATRRAENGWYFGLVGLVFQLVVFLFQCFKFVLFGPCRPNGGAGDTP